MKNVHGDVNVVLGEDAAAPFQAVERSQGEDFTAISSPRRCLSLL